MKKNGKMMMRFEPVQKSNTYRLYIYDDVSAYGRFDWTSWSYVESETSAAYFRQHLEEIPEDATIELYINSNGGSVKEGVSIYNQLKRHPAQKVGIVDGVCYSVAMVILQACDKRVMNLGTSGLVHNMLMEVFGNSKDLRQAADDLDNLMISNRQIFIKRSGKIEESQLIELMESEKILTPDECLEYGFIDEINETEVIVDESVQASITEMNPLMLLHTQREISNAVERMEKLVQIIEGKEPQPNVPDTGNNNGNEGQHNDVCQSFLNAIF